MDHSIPSHLDPPNNLFRIRLVCVLLETCGNTIYFIYTEMFIYNCSRNNRYKNDSWFLRLKLFTLQECISPVVVVRRN